MSSPAPRRRRGSSATSSCPTNAIMPSTSSSRPGDPVAPAPRPGPRPGACRRPRACPSTGGCSPGPAARPPASPGIGGPADIAMLRPSRRLAAASTARASDAFCPRSSSTRSAGDEQVRIGSGPRRTSATERGLAPRAAESASANTASIAELATANSAARTGIRPPRAASQRQQIPQTEAGQVLPVHERVREPAAGQERGDAVPVAGPHGPVDGVSEVAAAPRTRPPRAPADRGWPGACCRCSR